MTFVFTLHYYHSMDRMALVDLQSWKNRPDRKPLIVHGARQVGKTWLLKEFARTAYKNVAYINFEANQRMASLFASNLDVQRLLTGLRIEAGCPIDKENTLIIFDEVQENPSALASLKYFAENAPEYHIAAAGSLLGLAMHKNVSFPVGKVEFLDLFPMSFAEFLWAMGEKEAARLIREKDWLMADVFKDRLIDLLKHYFCVGGMPACVDRFAKTRDVALVRDTQFELLRAYEQDFSKHAEPSIVPRIRAVWNSIPSQLAREQRKFTYGLVREGARAREYETAIQWLCDAGLLFKVNRVSKPGIPLRSYQEGNAFKLFLVDTGLLVAHARIPLRTLLEGSDLFEEAKGALAEQYAAQEIRLRNDFGLFYWSSATSQGEVDFLVQHEDLIYPIEVKASENLQSKSLKAYRDKFSPRRSFRTSLSPYREESWLTNLPLYGISSLLT